METIEQQIHRFFYTWDSFEAKQLKSFPISNIDLNCHLYKADVLAGSPRIRSNKDHRMPKASLRASSCNMHRVHMKPHFKFSSEILLVYYQMETAQIFVTERAKALARTHALQNQHY